MATKPKLDADLSGEPVDETDYRSKIGSLMYLTSSRPDIVQAVCYYARYQLADMFTKALSEDRDKNQVCLLCEVILKQIPAFNFFCASLESITAIEMLGKWEKENEVFQDMQLIQKLRDDQKCMKKVEHSSRSKATKDIINIGSFMEVLVLNHYVLVRKIL
ncbi:hypothetical protein Tco_0236154 [Tanacetum coccineum]